MILLISAEDDTATDCICGYLSYQNKMFVRLSEHQFLTSVCFDLYEKFYKISIEGTSYFLNQFSSVFYRNGTITYHEFKDEIDSELRIFFDNELKAIVEFIYFLLNESGARIFGNLFTKNINKLHVLYTAKSLGLKIPETYVFSQLEDIRRLAATKQFITKSISEMMPIFTDGKLFLNYTKDLDFKNLPQNFLPSLVQEKVHKDFEIKVFFFHVKIWAIATFDFFNNTDVRSQRPDQKKYIPYQLSEDITEKIFSLAAIHGLNCGTIDLLKTGKDYFFLEVNPLGHFREVSYYGNFEIENYIANLL